MESESTSEPTVMHEAVVVEIRPKGRKLDILRRHVGLCRFVWNWTLAQHQKNGWPIGGKAGLADRIKAVEAAKRGEKTKLPKKISTQELSRRWTQEVDGTAPWARELARTTVTYAIRAVDDAYKHAFRRIKEGKTSKEIGWPRFRGKVHPHRAFTLQDQSFRYTRSTVKLGKIGCVRICNKFCKDPLDRLQGARVLRIVVEERAERWFCTLMVERPYVKPEPAPLEPVVGMDLGFKITLSDGTIFSPPKPLATRLRWIEHWGRALSRRTRPGEESSKRRLKAKKILAQLHLSVAFIRKNWIHQVTTQIAKKYCTVVTEGFDVARLIEQVDVHARRRTILDIGWGDLRRTLAYKMQRSGRTLLQLGKHELTDQTCSCCGATNPRTDGEFRCPNDACGHRDSRPRNTAALLERIGKGDPPRGFGSGNGVALAGQAGVNARGARNASEDSSSKVRALKRERSSNNPDRDAGGKVRPTISQNARKTEDRARSAVRASARRTKTSEPRSLTEEEGPRNATNPR